MKYAHRRTFPNGYTASVVCHDRSYGGRDGLFEVAVMVGDETVYDTTVMGDVSGHCDFFEVAELLKEIEALPPRS